MKNLKNLSLAIVALSFIAVSCRTHQPCPGVGSLSKEQKEKIAFQKNHNEKELRS